MSLPRCLLWLDDLREPPPGFSASTQIIWCKNVPEAIAALSEYAFDLISMDHDLGENQLNGAQFASIIEDMAHNGVLRPVRLQIHSANPVGRQNMLAACRNAYESWGMEGQPRVITSFISYCQEVREAANAQV